MNLNFSEHNWKRNLHPSARLWYLPHCLLSTSPSLIQKYASDCLTHVVLRIFFNNIFSEIISNLPDVIRLTSLKCFSSIFFFAFSILKVEVRRSGKKFVIIIFLCYSSTKGAQNERGGSDCVAVSYLNSSI